MIKTCSASQYGVLVWEAVTPRNLVSYMSSVVSRTLLYMVQRWHAKMIGRSIAQPLAGRQRCMNTSSLQRCHAHMGHKHGRESECPVPLVVMLNC